MEKTNQIRLFTGFTGLDDVIGGIAREDVVCLAARPGIGKTAFALDIAVNLAVKNAKRVAIFSLEDSEDLISSRVLNRKACTASSLNENALKSAGVISVYANPKMNISKIKEVAAAAGDFDILILDYLQLLALCGKNKRLGIACVMAKIKEAAIELQTPIMVLSQLSRKTERRKDHRPRIQDIPSSSLVTAYADIILFLYREAYYDCEANRTDAWCFVLEKPFSNTKAVPMKWYASSSDGHWACL